MSRIVQGTGSVCVPDSPTWPVLSKLVMGREAQLSSWGAGATHHDARVWPPAPLGLGTWVLSVTAPGGPAFHCAQPRGGVGGYRRVLRQSLSPQPGSPEATRFPRRGYSSALTVSAFLHWVLSPPAISGHVLSPRRGDPKLSSFPNAC